MEQFLHNVATKLQEAGLKPRTYIVMQVAHDAVGIYLQYCRNVTGDAANTNPLTAAVLPQEAADMAQASIQDAVDGRVKHVSRQGLHMQEYHKI